jgi:hypothetical protein
MVTVELLKILSVTTVTIVTVTFGKRVNWLTG